MMLNDASTLVESGVTLPVLPGDPSSCGRRVGEGEPDVTLSIRRYQRADDGLLWALNNLPFQGATADSSLPLLLTPAVSAPAGFPDLADIRVDFIAAGGDFLVAEDESAILGMAGFRPLDRERVEMLRVRVHPAARRRRVGHRLMAALEARASELGYGQAVLDTSTVQPEAIAFYRALGYTESGRETRPDWHWTLVYFSKGLQAHPSPTPCPDPNPIVDG